LFEWFRFWFVNSSIKCLDCINEITDFELDFLWSDKFCSNIWFELKSSSSLNCLTFKDYLLLLFGIYDIETIDLTDYELLWTSCSFLWDESFDLLFLFEEDYCCCWFKNEDLWYDSWWLIEFHFYEPSFYYSSLESDTEKLSYNDSLISSRLKLTKIVDDLTLFNYFFFLVPTYSKLDCFKIVFSYSSSLF